MSPVLGILRGCFAKSPTGWGTRVRIDSVAGKYPLPEGAQVVVLAIEPGMRAVEFKGRRFEVAQTWVDSGLRVVKEAQNRAPLRELAL